MPILRGRLLPAIVRIILGACLIAVLPVRFAAAAGPATITQVVHCSDNGGESVFTLSDGSNLLVYDSVSSDQFSKNLLALMTAAWIAGRTVISYAVGTPGSNCGIWAANLTSVTFQ